MEVFKRIELANIEVLTHNVIELEIISNLTSCYSICINWDDLIPQLINVSVSIRENIFDWLFSVHNIISLSLHEQVERYFSHHRAMYLFFNYWLAVPRPPLGHSWEDSLNNPMLINAFSAILTGRSPGVS